MILKGITMELDTAIETRRSIRRFTPELVSRHVLGTVLRAAMQAPSARDERPWHFVVISERSTLDRIAEWHPDAKMLFTVQTAIAVCGELTNNTRIHYWLCDCACATQNLLLSAHANGLGAVWVGIYPVEERMELVRDLLRLPKDVVPLNIIPLGYPGETRELASHFDPGRVHYERF